MAHRIAHCLELAGTNFLLVGDSHIFLRDAAGLAGDRHDLEAMALQDGAQYLRVIDEADAVRDADLAVAHALGELDDLFDSRPLAVTFGLDQRRFTRDL